VYKNLIHKGTAYTNTLMPLAHALINNRINFSSSVRWLKGRPKACSGNPCDILSLLITSHGL